MSPKNTIAFLSMLLLFLPAVAQTEVDERAVISFDKGLGFFAPDSSFGFNLRFRMQNRIGMTTISGKDLHPSEFEANVRRLRLRFDGFMGKTGLTYYLQLSFSRSDQDWDASGFPGIVRDAMIFYTFSDHFYMGLGQGKLPGNRQRVISSGQQQFTDRSLVNAIFTIDRDFGIMAYYSNHIQGFHFNLKSAVSSGEGRNILRSNSGLAYTARVELLPLGQFKSDGDFSEGDLAREPAPRISFGLTASMNKDAIRAAGQRGQFLDYPTDINNYFVDMVAKFQGWALQSEFARREASHQPAWWCMDPVNDFSDLVYVYTGYGHNTQLSYVFRNLFEIAGRVTIVRPTDEISRFEPKSRILAIGCTKYLPNHRNKVQLLMAHQTDTFPAYLSTTFWNFMFQIELGI